MLDCIIVFNQNTNKFEFKYWNKNWESMCKYGLPKITRWIGFESFGPTKDKVGLITGLLSKLEILCVTDSDLVTAVTQIFIELKYNNYTWGSIKTAIRSRMTKSNYRLWKTILMYTHKLQQIWEGENF